MLQNTLLRGALSGIARVAATPLTNFARSFSDGEAKHTACYESHVRHGGRMVPFAGYSLAVTYKESHIPAHKHVRENAGLFDVSHMGQVMIHGPREHRLKFLEGLCVADLFALKDGQAQLSTLTNENGGIIDDCIITPKKDHVYMVVNGACKVKDLAHMREQLELYNRKNGTAVEIEYLDDTRALLALQGPKAKDVLTRLTGEDISKFWFMNSRNMQLLGEDCWVARCGYTGEDGFEISIPEHKGEALMEALLAEPEVQPSGLGVRDSLRLEAGLCLYGNDLNDTITPVEGSLLWCIGKRRRKEGGFLGADTILKQIADGVSKKRVGLTILGGPPAREHSEILDMEGNPIGEITSGTHSPCLNKKIAMGYVQFGFHKKNTPVQVKVRGKVNDAVVTPMPWTKAGYYNPPKPKKAKKAKKN